MAAEGVENLWHVLTIININSHLLRQPAQALIFCAERRIPYFTNMNIHNTYESAPLYLSMSGTNAHIHNHECVLVLIHTCLLS